MIRKIFLVSALALALMVGLQTLVAPQFSAAAAEEMPAPQWAMQPVVSPPVPAHVLFAGEKINIDTEELYERLDRELSQMSYTHSSTMLMLKRANRYFPEIVPVLKRNGVPEDLVYLACIESTLNPRAYSPAKAAGLWQFLATTAKEYGLEVNDYVDERYHIEKATAAAARFLKRAYNKYGNWESAMASYNGGQARITKELDAQLVSSAHDLYLVEETSRYPFRVYAAKTLMEHPARYGFHLKPSQFYKPHSYTEITIDTTIEDLPAWAQSHGINYATLREYNPWLRAKKLPVAPGKSYTIRLPRKESLKRQANQPSKNQLYNPNWAD